MEDALSRFSNNGNQKTTQESTYITENMSEINDIEESSKSNYPNNFKWIDQYQRKDLRLMAKYKTGYYKRALFVEEVIAILLL